jgi:DNA-binding response OmpR family regulator
MIMADGDTPATNKFSPTMGTKRRVYMTQDIIPPSTILVIEDDLGITDMFEHFCEEYPELSLVIAKDIETAYREFQNHKDSLIAVYVDGVMPQSNNEHFGDNQMHSAFSFQGADNDCNTLEIIAHMRSCAPDLAILAAASRDTNRALQMEAGANYNLQQKYAFFAFLAANKIISK